jgi:excisionase family DNA binding protein
MRLPTLLTISDASAIMRLHERTVRRWIARGWLRAVRRGRFVRVLSEDLLAFIEANRVGIDARPSTTPQVT